MRWWIWTLVAIGWLKIAVALPGYAFVEIPLNAETPFPAWVYAANLAIFGACGSLLLVGGRRDPRAQLLGAVCVLVASLFANRPLASLPASSPSWLLAAAEVMRGVEPGAFRSVLAWLFASTFPRDALSGFWRRLASFGKVVSGLVGTMLFAIGLVQLVLRIATTEATAAVASQPLITNQNGIWRLNTALTLAAIPLVLLNARAAGLAERRRVRLFVWALALGAGPILIQVLMEFLVPPYGALMDRQFPRFLSGMIFYPLLWTGLGVAAYSVYAAEVLTVRLVVRRAIRYAFARTTIIVCVSVPFSGVFWILYSERGRPLADVLSGPRQLTLLILVGAGLTLLAMRRRMLDSLDRRFFREQYDARRILGELIDEVRRATAIPSLVTRLASEINRALHLEAVDVLVADFHRRAFMHGSGIDCDLPLEATVVTLLRGGVEAMDLNLDDPRHSALQRLPAGERAWIVRGGYRLLVPVKSSTGDLVSVIALGRKRSELPFSAADRWLLSAIAASTAVAIENITLRSSTPAAVVDSSVAVARRELDAAMECEQCFAVQEVLDARVCSRCSGPVRTALVPRVLRAMRLERRIGAGGMGVVYRGVDTELRRFVAVKTLPGLSVADEARLRREARAMAAAAHSNVATIFAIERWRDRPLLIVEYFDAGTLRDRLNRGPMQPADILNMGNQLAAGLQHMHQQLGMLHRDIKPSNIAFDQAGIAKLLDFGLAKSVRQEPLSNDQSTVTDVAIGTLDGWSSDTSRRAAGTLAYFSPELLESGKPDQWSDLWALTLVLYEAMAGLNPLGGSSALETIDKIRQLQVPDLREFAPECSETLALFFLSALARDLEARPRSAEALSQELQRLRQALAR